MKPFLCFILLALTLPILSRAQNIRNEKFLQAVSLYRNATLIATSHPDSAAAIYLRAETELREFDTKEAILTRAKCWHDYARILHLEKDDPENYLDILLNKAIPLARQSGDEEYLGKNYLDVALGFKNLREHKKAEGYLIKAIETLKKAEGSFEYLASAYHTLSENYSLSGNPAQAAAMLDSMKMVLAPHPESAAWLDYFAGEGMRLTIAEQFDRSLFVINKGIELARKLKQEYPEQRLLLQKFYALYNKKDFINARNTALDLTKRIPFINIAANRVQLFYALALTYEELKDTDEAYYWLKKYSSLSDSIASSNLETKINSLEIKFRNAENQKKIAELNAANEKVRFSEKNSRLINWLLGAVSLFLLTGIIFSYIFYKNNKKLSAQKEETKITRAILQGQEDERRRVARDLHDGLGGMLAGIKITLAEFAKEKQPGDSKELNKIIHQLDDSVKELRHIAHNMMPEMLLKLGLEAALRDLCESMVSEKLDVDFHYLGTGSNLTEEEQLTIYRIAQELLTNVVKHASAKNVLLQCSQRNNIFFLTIEDDGKGYYTNQPDENKGIGMNSIKSRLEYLNGKMEILAKEGHEGTSINIELHVTA